MTWLSTWAVMHTLREIDRLWEKLNSRKGNPSPAPAVTIAAAFAMSADDLKAKGIKYQAFFDKVHVPSSLLNK